ARRRSGEGGAEHGGGGGAGRRLRAARGGHRRAAWARRVADRRDHRRSGGTSRARCGRGGGDATASRRGRRGRPDDARPRRGLGRRFRPPRSPPAAAGPFAPPAGRRLAVRRQVRAGGRGRGPETLEAGDPLLSKARTVVVGRNRDAVAAAATAAKARGYDTSVVAGPLHGDAASAGRAVAGALAAARRDRPVAVVGGGETTVRVVGDGRGGRCQHLALT